MKWQFTLYDLFSFSITFGAVIGWVRFRRINPIYYPFVFCIWLAFFNEVAGYFLIYSGHYNALNNNIYVLAESLLITWQFRRWHLFDQRLRLYFILLTTLILSWLTDAIFFSGFSHTINYFRIFYSFVIVLMSIIRFNQELMVYKGNLLKNPLILVCLGFILYFMFKVITGVFWLYGFGGSVSFRRHMQLILIYTNVFANLVYAYAILWMKKRLQFSLPS